MFNPTVPASANPPNSTLPPGALREPPSRIILPATNNKLLPSPTRKPVEFDSGLFGSGTMGGATGGGATGCSATGGTSLSTSGVVTGEKSNGSVDESGAIAENIVINSGAS